MKRYILLLILAIAANHAVAQELLPQAEKYKLKNGLEVLFVDFGNIRATAFTVYVNTGTKSETPGQQALSTLTANTILLGNARYDRIKQDSIFQSFGTGITASVNDNFTTIQTQFLNRDIEKGVEVLSAILRDPTFPDGDIQQEKNQLLDFNTPAKMDIGELSSVYSKHVVYGSGHPLGRHFYAAQLQKINRQAVMDYYKFNFTPKNTRIVVTGKPDRALIKKLLDQHFGSWEAAFGEMNDAAYDIAPIKKKEFYFVNRAEATQAALQWNKPAPSAISKDVIPFYLANIIFNKKLFDEIRAKEGKTYGIGSRFPEADNNGIFTITTQVRSEVAYETIRSLERVLGEFNKSGITEKELATAKKQLVNRFRSVESPLQLAGFYNPILYPDTEKRRSILAEIEKMDLPTVNKTVKKYFTPESYKLVIAGDETMLKSQLDKISGLNKLELGVIEVDQ